MTSNSARKVALFPLCDVHSILLDALKTGDLGTSTRPDALVFAWLLELPKGIDAAQAARAILAVACNHPGWSRNAYQRVLIRELQKLVRMVEKEEHQMDPRAIAHGRWKEGTRTRSPASIKASKLRKQKSLERFLLLSGSRDDAGVGFNSAEKAERDRKILSDRIKKARDGGLFNRSPDNPE